MSEKLTEEPREPLLRSMLTLIDDLEKTIVKHRPTSLDGGWGTYGAAGHYWRLGTSSAHDPERLVVAERSGPDARQFFQPIKVLVHDLDGPARADLICALTQMAWREMDRQEEKEKNRV